MYAIASFFMNTFGDAKIGGLKRSVGLLEQVHGNSEQRLGELLAFEF